MLIASLLFGISASLDALLVGVSYGIRQIRIRLWQNLLISLVTLLGTCLSVGCGQRLAEFFPKALCSYAGSLILIFLGLYYIIKWAVQRTGPIDDCRKTGCEICKNTCDGTCTKEIIEACVLQSLRSSEILSLSLTLSLNNLSAGLSASLAGLPLAPAAVSTFACSVLFLSTGNRLGSHPMLQLAGRAADPLSGLLLIGLGLLQFFW